MAKYLVTYTETRCVETVVEADSEDDAYEEFHNRSDPDPDDWRYHDEATEIQLKEDE